MSRFDRRRGAGIAPAGASAPAPTLLHGEEPYEVVTDPAQQDPLWKLTGARRGTPISADLRATLEPERDAPAAIIAVHIEGLRVGELGADDAAELIAGLHAVRRRNSRAVAVRSRVIGGAAARVGDRRQLDVWIYLDPIDFGLDPPALEAVRTGHSAAADPRWAGALPRAHAERTRFLRAELRAEREPLQRHLMWNALEDVLFRTRDSAPLAFDDYEAAVIAHDAEMATILPSLFDEFGGVPELPAYAKLAHLLALRRRTADAYRWANRGLELYGEHGTHPAAVDQLRARACALAPAAGGPAHTDVTTAPAAEPVNEAPAREVLDRHDSETSAPAGWYRDPTARAELRFWDGARWTQHISNNGTTGVDLLDTNTRGR
jgi:hypothetical protein